MITKEQYLALDACAMAESLAAGDLTSSELMECAIAQKEKVNGQLNAVNVDLSESAWNHAQQADKETGRNQHTPFLGIPFLIKDLTDLKGAQITHGSRLYTTSSKNGPVISDQNAKVVKRYLDSGLLMLGKTNTPEFGLSVSTEPVANGPCANPWHTDYSTGGSSGGAAAAVAAGIVPVAHATDAGGSIRIPASCCGLLGLKPSRGLVVSDDDMLANRSGLTVNHVLSRSVRDSASFLDIVRLRKPELFPLPDVPQDLTEASQQIPGPLRIMLQTEHPFGESIDEDCLRAVTTLASCCESLGHKIEDMSAQPDYRAAARAMNKILCAHTFQQVRTRLQVLDISLEQADLETSTRQMTEAGSRITAADYAEALTTLDRIREEMRQLFCSSDLLLSPVLAKTPARLGWLNMNANSLEDYAARYRCYSGFTPLANGAGLPSLSIPAVSTSEGLPVGAMFTGAWGSDLILLKLAYQIEQTQPWPMLAPIAND
ncbi:MAG: amidase family protein [Gammaproteobacteria bacterium]|nr:amidase family protein [Gammaproteobacteria bacterium]